MAKENRGRIKIAFLIMAHNNPQMLNWFLKQILQYENAEVFIHIDQKGIAIIPDILVNDRIHILQEHIWAKWGDYSQIAMADKLIRAAVEYADFDYFTLHSGCDLAIRPVNEFAEYLEKTKKYCYCDCNPLPVKNWGHGGGLERIALYYPEWLRQRFSGKHPLRYVRSIYQRLFEHGIVKGKKLPQKYSFYGGGQWFTICRECVQDYMDFVIANPDYDILFRKAMNSDEIYFNSIFNMTKSDRMVENHNLLMYIDWKNRGQKNTPGSPNTMRYSFKNEIEESGMFFARKFDFNLDKEVINYFLQKSGVFMET